MTAATKGGTKGNSAELIITDLLVGNTKVLNFSFGVDILMLLTIQ
jgi:hypothetical protein